MALDVYFREDIVRALTGLVTVAIETAQMSGCANVDHINGVLTLAKGIALGFGIHWREIEDGVRTALRTDLGVRLDVTIVGMLQESNERSRRT